MALGDCLQQSREMHMDTGRAPNWRRTGERGLMSLQCANGPCVDVLMPCFTHRGLEED